MELGRPQLCLKRVLQASLLILLGSSITSGNSKSEGQGQEGELKAVCLAVKQDSSRRTNNPAEPDNEIDLIVMGADKTTRGGDIFDIEIQETLYGDWPGKTVRYYFPRHTRKEASPAIFALAPMANSWSAPENQDRFQGATHTLKYVLPGLEVAGARKLGLARMDLNILSREAIVVGHIVPQEFPSSFYHVKINKVLHGKGLARGTAIDVYDYGNRLPEERQGEQNIYLFSEFTVNRHGKQQFSGISRLPLGQEARVSKILGERTSFPIIELKVSMDGEMEQFHEITLRGSYEEAIQLLGSSRDAIVTLGLRTLFHGKDIAKDKVIKAVTNYPWSTSVDGSGKYRQLRNLIRALDLLGEGSSSGAVGVFANRLLGHLESTQSTTVVEGYQYHDTYYEFENSNRNHSLAWLLDTMEEEDVVKHYGTRLLLLRDTLSGYWKTEVKLAMEAVCLEDNIELAIAKRQTGGMTSIQTERPMIPQKKKDGGKPKPSDLIDAFFQPADRASLLYHPQGNTLQTHFREGVVEWRDPETLEVQRTFKIPVGSKFINWRPSDGRYALCKKAPVKRYRHTQVIDLTDGKVVCELPLEIGWGARGNHVFWLPGNELLILDNSVKRVEDTPIDPKGLDNRLQFRWIRINYSEGKILEEEELGYQFFNHRWLQTENPQLLYSIDGGYRFTRFEVSTYDLSFRKEATVGEFLLSSRSPGNARGLVPGGKYFYVGDPGIYLFDRKTLRPVMSKELREHSLLELCFSKDGKQFAVVTGGRQYLSQDMELFDPGTESTVRVHDTLSGKTIYAFPSPTRWIRSMTFTPNGKGLLLLREDNVLDLRKFPEGKK